MPGKLALAKISVKPARGVAPLLADLRGLILAAREQVARAVDSGLVTLYWHIGRRIRRDILKEKRAEYGAEILSALSAKLETEFGRGFGEKSLRHMLRFAEAYATEADLLNVALFGHTARQWRDPNPKLEGNVRDYASVEQLLVLANMEGMNAEFIHMGLPQGERLKRLNQIAIRQMQVLTSANLKALPGGKEK